MSMTTKNYYRLVEIIALPVEDYSAAGWRKHMVNNLVSYLKADNPRFDEKVFREYLGAQIRDQTEYLHEREDSALD